MFSASTCPCKSIKCLNACVPTTARPTSLVFVVLPEPGLSFSISSCKAWILASVLDFSARSFSNFAFLSFSSAVESFLLFPQEATTTGSNNQARTGLGCCVSQAHNTLRVKRRPNELPRVVLGRNKCRGQACLARRGRRPRTGALSSCCSLTACKE